VALLYLKILAAPNFLYFLIYFIFFQQDGAPSHTSHLVQNWLSDNIDMLWSKEFWPPNRQDLNLLDYYVWSVVERVTNRSRHPNVTSLRTAIETAFADIDSATTCMRTLQIDIFLIFIKFIFLLNILIVLIVYIFMYFFLNILYL